MWKFLHPWARPERLYGLCQRLTPWFAWPAAVMLVTGCVWGFVFAPPDYQQGDSYRIMYLHVPAAMGSMGIYASMAVAAFIGLVWQNRAADLAVIAMAPVGAVYTFIALTTGSAWGKPMWGTWWIWDARLTSELVLLFLYAGVIALWHAFDDRRLAGRAAGILVLVGVVNLPIIHYSVEWWNTLHQPASITKFDTPSIHISMLIPLLLMALGFKLFYVVNMLSKTRSVILEREANTSWVRSRLQENKL